MSSRTHRKALPLDTRGIHWGNGERHESGTPWKSVEWKRFVLWALENGASSDFGIVVGWLENGHLHRENGPARVLPNGHEEWYLNNQRHRENGPAIIEPQGYEAWFLNGQRHREDGPARVWRDGHEEWWLNGQQYTDGTFTTLRLRSMVD
jgi:hypothetical protein